MRGMAYLLHGILYSTYHTQCILEVLVSYALATLYIPCSSSPHIAIASGPSLHASMLPHTHVDQGLICDHYHEYQAPPSAHYAAKPSIRARVSIMLHGVV